MTGYNNNCVSFAVDIHRFIRLRHYASVEVNDFVPRFFIFFFFVRLTICCSMIFTTTTHFSTDDENEGDDKVK